MIAESLFGLNADGDGLAFVLDCAGEVRSRLWAAGLPEDILGVDPRAGLRLSEEFGD